MRRIIWIMLTILLFVGLTACSNESQDFTMHEPGLYKGGKDPLLNKNMDQELKTRFMQVQTDR